MSVNQYTQQVDRVIRVLHSSRDPNVRLAALNRLYRLYVRISRCEFHQFFQSRVLAILFFLTVVRVREH